MKRYLLYFLIFSFVLSVNQSYSQIGEYALKFDGIDDYVAIPNTGTGVLGNNSSNESFTIETWFRAGVNSSNVKIFSKHSNFFPRQGYSLEYTADLNNIIILYANNLNQWSSVTGSINVKDGKWHHLVYVYNNAGNISLYIDGILQGTSAPFTPSHPSTLDLRIMATEFYNQFTAGEVDEFRVWNDIRTADEINKFMFRDVSSEANLLVYYKMSNGSGTSLLDHSGNSNTGTLVNGTSWIASGALDGARKAIEFDGTNHISIPGTAPLNFDGMSTFTFETWIYYNNLTSSAIFERRGTFGQTELTFFLDNASKLNFFVGKQSIAWQNVLTSNKTMPNQTWTHLSIVKSGASVSLYINGELDATGTLNSTSQTATPSEATISLGNGGFGGYLNGRMDELRFWNSARTESQIRENMMKSLVGNESNLITYYRFNQTGSTTLFDFTSNNRNGTLVDMNPANCWISSSAFNTWIGVESNDITSATNWSDGLSLSPNIGLYKWNLANVTTYHPNLGIDVYLDNIYVSPTSSPSVNSNVYIQRHAFLESSINLNNNTVYFSETGKLFEGNGVFWGVGAILTERVLNNIVAENVAGFGAVITTSQNLGTTVLSRTHIPTGFNSKSILRQFHINPTNNTGLNATLVFKYLDAELNSNTEANLKAYRSTNQGTNWGYYGGIVNTTDNLLTLTGLNSFSSWTLASSPLNEILFVNHDATGNNDGSDWPNAFTTLQQALDIAFTDNKIWVAAGTYKPTSDYGLGGGSRFNHFRMKNGVGIYGGFAGTENPSTFNLENRNFLTNETILSGDLNDNGVDNNDAYHLVYHPTNIGLNSTAILDGFTISGGNANGTGDHSNGGGIFLHISSPQFRNLTVINNYASQFGGGIYLNGTEFSGKSNIILTNGLIANNSATGYGGVYINSSSPTFNNVTIVKNSATGQVGGFGAGNFSNPVLNNCIIWGNTAVVTYNQIYSGLGGNLTLRNSNYSTFAHDVYIFSPVLTNVIHTDPKFRDFDGNNFKLYGNSPCVNNGNNTYNTLGSDIRGQARIQNTTIDMGAYEWTSGTDKSNPVYVSEDYSGGNPSGFGITHYNSLTTALTNSTTDATVNITNYSHSGNVDITGRTFIVGAQDFDITGTLSGGLIRTTGTGRLMQTAVQNTPRTFPVTDGTNNFTVTITPTSESTSGMIGVKLNTGKVVEGTLVSPMTFFDIYGDEDLDATVFLRIDKAAISPATMEANTIMRFWNGERYQPIPTDRVTISDQVDCYIITITGMNYFNNVIPD